MRQENFLFKENTLSGYYQKQYEQLRQQNPGKDILLSSAPAILTDHETWYRSLAMLEYLLDQEIADEEVVAFFKQIFRSYDHYVSVDLNSEDYDFFWKKLHEVLDKLSVFSTEALLEKALQYFNPRKGYVDKNKTLHYLQEGINRGDETCRLMLGYYYYMGFCGVTDKEKALELLDGFTTKEGEERTLVYKSYIALSENRKEEARANLEKILQHEPGQDSLRMAYELQAFMAEIDGNPEEAVTFYNKSLDIHPSGYAYLRLGVINYNKLIENPLSPEESLALYEKGFRYGRTDAANNLYYCYFESRQEWEDDEKGLYWLQMGDLYNEAYCSYELAFHLLFTDKYKATKKGLEFLERAIDLKYPNAYISKAYLIYEGELLPKDMDAVLSLLTEAMNQGYGNAAYRLAYLYEQGAFDPDGEPDYQTALAYYEKAAEMNEPLGCEHAGRYYLNGYAGDPDPEKARMYYEKGHTLNSPYCMVELALMYEDGDGVEADSVKSFELLKQAASHEYIYSYYLLGRCYKYALGTAENPDEAVAYFRKAAEGNQERAQAELAYCYESGYGLEISGRKALEYMLKSAENGYPYAQYKVGCYYLYGLDGVPADYEKALEWLQKGAENGYPYAWLELGDFYLYDYNKTGDQAKAYECYCQAAKEDIVNEGLGLCLFNGIGVEENDAEAFKYYLKAAEDGYVRGMYYAGWCYYHGVGIKENHTEAFRWFSDAAANQYPAALYYQAKMMLAGDGCPQNMGEGISCMQQAAEMDDRDAQFELGNCYLVGKGVDENEDVAMQWFEKAADNGHEQALKITGRRKRK